MSNTWTNPDAAVDADRVRVAKAACTSGSEVPAAATRLTDGLDLAGLESVTPILEMSRGSATITIVGAVPGKKITFASVDFVARNVRKASGTASLVSVVAGNKLTLHGHDLVARARFAKGTVTITTAVVGDSLVLNGVAFNGSADGAGLQEWAVGSGGTADNDSATNLAAAITAARARCRCTAAAVANVVTITAEDEGAGPNAYGLVGLGVPLAVSAATLAGGYDPSLDEWPIMTTDALTAAALAAAINQSRHAALKGIVTAAAVATNVCTITSVAEGATGNAIGLARTGSPISVSGATLAGAWDASAHEWLVGAGDTADTDSAVALAAALNASGLAQATSALGVVTVKDPTPGTAGNSTTLVSNDASMVCTGGGTLTGGTVIGANAFVRGYLLNPATGSVVRCPTFDVTLTAGLGSQGGPAIATNGLRGRLQLLPDTVGAACTVFAAGTPAPSIFQR